MSPAERRAHRHPAPLGRGGHRLALAQRLTKIKPAFLLAQSGQRRSGQRIEASAAILAAETAQAVGLAPAHRRPATVRNEIPAAPELIEALGMKGCLFTLGEESFVRALERNCAIWRASTIAPFACKVRSWDR